MSVSAPRAGSCEVRGPSSTPSRSGSPPLDHGVNAPRIARNGSSSSSQRGQVGGQQGHPGALLGVGRRCGAVRYVPGGSSPSTARRAAGEGELVGRDARRRRTRAGRPPADCGSRRPWPASPGGSSARRCAGARSPDGAEAPGARVAVERPVRAPRAGAPGRSRLQIGQRSMKRPCRQNVGTGRQSRPVPTFAGATVLVLGVDLEAAALGGVQLLAHDEVARARHAGLVE